MVGEVILHWGTVLTEEMLTWPIGINDGKDYQEKNLEFMRNVLRALLGLDGFSSRINLSAYHNRHRLFDFCQPRIDIYYDNNVIITESSSTNLPFYCAEYWMGVRRDEALGYSIEKIRDKFLEKIETGLKNSQKMAEGAVLKAEKQMSFVQSVLRHIGKLPVNDESEKPLHEMILIGLESSVAFYRRLGDATGAGAASQIETYLFLLRTGKIPDDKKGDIISSLNKMVNSITGEDNYRVRQKLLETIEILETK